MSKSIATCIFAEANRNAPTSLNIIVLVFFSYPLTLLLMPPQQTA